MTLSRIAIVGLLLAAPVPAQPPEVRPPEVRYAALTRVAIQRCSRATDSREIVVCGRRAADRWRLPIITYDLGDPRREGVPAERVRLSRDDRLPCGQGAVIANCGGGVGVAASVSFGVSGSEARLRPLAD